MATDQEIRDAGFKYIPKQKYLQNPFEIPTAPQASKPAASRTGILATGGGDNYSVYNADPNTIVNMNPNFNALTDARYDNELSYVGYPGRTVQTGTKIVPGVRGDEIIMERLAPYGAPEDFYKGSIEGIPRTIAGAPGIFSVEPTYGTGPLYSTRTEAIKNMERYPSYYGMDTIGDIFELDEKGQLVKDDKGNFIRKNQPSKINELLSKGIGLIPGGTFFTKVGPFIEDMLPTNRRAILENQLGTQGVMVDNIGRIVVGPGGEYNTPEGIMAGYNVSKMTDKTFDKRTGNIAETLKDKYKFNADDIANLNAGIITEEMEEKAFNPTMKKTSNLLTNYININKAKKNFQDSSDVTDNIFDLKEDAKVPGPKKPDVSDDDKGGGIDISGAGVIRSAQNAFKGDSGPTTQQEADYGYASDYGFAKGGRVYLNLGGLASIL